MKIAFIGYNVVGEHVKEILKQKNVIIEYIYFDDILYKKNYKNSFRFNDYKKIYNKGFNFVITLGYKHLQLKKNIINNLTQNKENIINVIDKTVILPNNIKLGNGLILYSGVILGENVEICDGVLLHHGVIVSHNTIIKEVCYLSPGVTVCGDVNIGECCFIGANTTISNDVIINKNSVIGIGSVITKNIEENTQGIGNPFKKLKKNLEIK